MRYNPVGWFEIYVSDMPRARAFYERVFEIQLEPLSSPDGVPGEMWLFPSDHKVAGIAGALVKQEGLQPGTGGTRIYFTCDDCAANAARVDDAGGQLQQDKMAIGKYGYIALALDSEGNQIGLHTRCPAEA